MFPAKQSVSSSPVSTQVTSQRGTAETQWHNNASIEEMPLWGSTQQGLQGSSTVGSTASPRPTIKPTIRRIVWADDGDADLDLASSLPFPSSGGRPTLATHAPLHTTRLPHHNYHVHGHGPEIRSYHLQRAAVDTVNKTPKFVDSLPALRTASGRPNITAGQARRWKQQSESSAFDLNKVRISITDDGEAPHLDDGETSHSSYDSLVLSTSSDNKGDDGGGAGAGAAAAARANTVEVEHIYNLATSNANPGAGRCFLDERGGTNNPSMRSHVDELDMILPGPRRRPDNIGGCSSRGAAISSRGKRVRSKATSSSTLAAVKTGRVSPFEAWDQKHAKQTCASDHGYTSSFDTERGNMHNRASEARYLQPGVVTKFTTPVPLPPPLHAPRSRDSAF